MQPTMSALDDIPGNMLRKPSGKPEDELERVASSYRPLHTFRLNKERSYKQQFADMYFLRLTKIKPAVDQIAAAAWADTVIGGEPCKKAERVLDIRQGELCWVSGTVYMDMPLKPNILEDVSKDRWISAPVSDNKYYSDDGSDAVTLEDESGRIRLTGDVLKDVVLVTGCIIAVLGTENVNGELEVIGVKFPGLPAQPDRWAVSKPPTNGTSKPKKVKDEDEEMTDSRPKGSGGKIAIVSGLSFSGNDTSHALELSLLLEYLLGEALDPAAQQELSHISRLIIAGNSISLEERPAADEDPKDKAQQHQQQKKYGYDSSSYNALPSQLLDGFLSALLPTMPVTLLPGAQDPANASYPQQPIHPAMFPKSRIYASQPGPGPGGKEAAGWFDTVTNPWEGEVDGWRVLGTGGQNIDDIFKYVGSDDRLGMMEATCRWRCCAPTAPDTLWSYPFQDDDPFVMQTCPHLYFVGCQPEFGTRVIRPSDSDSDSSAAVRLVAVPSFAATRELVLVDSETLDVSRVKISVG
ncbi:DNA polymerase alpha/epsilon subunit B-domain-containing protein [Biscogniauxia marginata]|nr:DNA polymerase alpha/epsilon subunit B-domain-containing protein [Biscogniauxia marginata]